MIHRTAMRLAFERAAEVGKPSRAIVRRIRGALRSGRGTRHVNQMWRINRQSGHAAN